MILFVSMIWFCGLEFGIKKNQFGYFANTQCNAIAIIFHRIYDVWLITHSFCYCFTSSSRLAQQLFVQIFRTLVWIYDRWISWEFTRKQSNWVNLKTDTKKKSKKEFITIDWSKVNRMLLLHQAFLQSLI